MPSITENRLAAALAAEAAILQGEEVRSGDRSLRMAKLEEVQKLINMLEAKLGREQARAAGGSGLNYAMANLSGNA